MWRVGGGGPPQVRERVRRMKPKELVLSLNAEILAQLERAQYITHPGENGRAREEIIRRFLRQLLPVGFGIDTGFIMDANELSRQVDLIIYRVGYHPIIEISGIRFFMIESVVAVLENKARILDKKPLDNAFDNIASVKRLDKTGGGRNHVLVGGTHQFQSVDPDAGNAQVFGAIVAGMSMQIETYVQLLHQRTEHEPPREWPSLYLGLDRETAVYFLKQLPGQLPEGTTTPTEYQRIGYSNPASPDAVPPLVNLAYWLVEYIRRSQIIDFQVGAYFPLSTSHTDGPAVPKAPQATSAPQART